MIYVLTNGGGSVVTYPYSYQQMKSDNPQVSFPATITDEVAAPFNTFPVVEHPQPNVNPLITTIDVLNPLLMDGIWEQQWGQHDYDAATAAAYEADYRVSLGHQIDSWQIAQEAAGVTVGGTVWPTDSLSRQRMSTILINGSMPTPSAYPLTFDELQTIWFTITDNDSAAAIRADEMLAEIQTLTGDALYYYVIGY